MTTTFEKQNKSVNKVKSSIEYIAKTSNTKQEAINRLRDVLPETIKLGFGGSHVWGANENNERIFILIQQ
jgi:hypothetical protein